ncbi:MAG: methyltransferase domain-containing protein [Candidatus Omnitrophota bacterium]|nr:methyltransferase domain-containing protein [Candidatus Omnitrophota bacterium]
MKDKRNDSDYIKLCCPDCKLVLSKKDGQIFCEKCHKIFPVIDGVPSFIEGNAFYEAKWVVPHPYDVSLVSRLAFLFSSPMQFIKKHIAAKKKILDLGCGAGNAFYAKAATVVGIDVSLASLKKAKDIYDIVIQADVLKLPFENEIFDLVVSYDLIGHIAQEHKEKLFAEICRVLKPGGRTIHYIETEGNNKLEQFAKKYPQLYDKYFIKQDGHIGLEKPSAILKRFKQHGFKCVAKITQSFTALRFPREYLKRFDNEYKQKSFLVRTLVKFCRAITIAKILEYPFKLFIVFYEYLTRRIFPLDAASGICVCCEKKKIHVCIISGAYPLVDDGIGDYTAKLIDNLNKENLEISLITSDEEAIRRYLKETNSSRVYPIIKKWNIFAIIAVLKLIRKERFDIIHLQFPSSRYKKTFSLCFLPFFIRIFFKNIKVIVTLHEFSISYSINKIRQFILSLGSHRVIVTDKNDFERLKNILIRGGKKISIIPIGSNIDVCGYKVGEKEHFLEKLGFDSQAKIIAFFGFIHRSKGIEFLLKAIKKVIDDGFKVHLVLICRLDSDRNSYHNAIKRLIDYLGIKKSIFVTGYAESCEVSKYLSFSDICVLPFTDGVTLRRGTLMAAFSHRKAVISTQSGRDIPVELADKENIFLVPVGDIRRLAEAIELLYKDNRLRQKIEKGAAELAERFSWNTIAIAHEKLYRSITGKF